MAAEAASLVSDGHCLNASAVSSGDAAEAASLVSDGHLLLLSAMSQKTSAAEAASLVSDGHLPPTPLPTRPRSRPRPHLW